MRLSTLRRATQGITFAFFILLFFFTLYPFAEKFPMEFFLRLDPLVALVAMAGSRALIVTMLWSVAILILTLLLGRFFCGYICPLGTFIDITGVLFFKKHSKKENIEPKPGRRIKYLILIAIVTGSLLGANALHFFSPMSIMPKALTLIIYPPLIALLNVLIDGIRPLAVGMGFDDMMHFSFQQTYFTGHFLVYLLFGGIIAANFWRKRFWCRYVCPTGAFISLFSRYSPFKRRVAPDVCTSCLRCNMKCDMRAIDKDPKKTVLSECTLCGVCADVCPQKNCITFGTTPFGFAGNNGTLQVERRSFIYSAITGLFAATTLKSGIHNKRNLKGQFIRPPGAIPETDFLARCIRCGECMKVCKTNALHPAVLQSGLDALWTPELKPRVGACEEKCNMCGFVCPTRAIRALPLHEKQFAKIGTAVIDRHRCIAWEQNKLCLICDEICPYDAIEFRIVETTTGPFKVPIVFEDKCVGCGWCEHKCPVEGRAAIEVYAIGEERFAKGSYITAQKQKMREIRDTHEASYDVDALGSGGETMKGSEIQSAPVENTPAPQESEELPGGIILE